MGGTSGSGLKAETRYARELFLYGGPDGVRVVNVQKLADMAGVSRATIHSHVKAWETEYQQIVAASNETGLTLRLREDTLKEHERDLEFLRDKMNSLRWEIDNLDETVAKLEHLAERLTENNETSKALRAFENYCRGSLNRKSLLTLFLQVKKQWDEKVSLDALRDVAITREKELQKHKARQQAKEGDVPEERDVTPRKFFALDGEGDDTTKDVAP